MKKIWMIILLLFSQISLAQTPLGTYFTYQGELLVNGQPTTNNYDFIVNVYDAVTGGTQQNGQFIGNVPVTNGLFTLTIDLGETTFAGEERWLDLGVRTVGGSTTTTLTPRKLITNTPYTIHAQFVGQDGVNTLAIKNASVTTSKLANASVTTAKLADASVTATKLADASVTTTKLANVSVTTINLADASVTGTKLVNASVSNDKLADASVTTVKLANASVTATKLANASVTTVKLLDNSITTEKIFDGTISTADIADSAITSLKIAANTIGQSEIATGGVGTNEIADFSIVAADIDNTSVQQRVVGTCAAGSSIRSVAVDGTVICETDDTGTSGWNLTGNTGTNPATNFVGTTDNSAFNLRVNNTNALEITPFSGGAINTLIGKTSGNKFGNLIGEDNTITGGSSNLISGTGNNNVISGGNSNNIKNGVMSVISGGIENTVSNSWSVVPGGQGNKAGGWHSFAAGYFANIRSSFDVGGGDINGDERTFVWSQTGVTSTGPDQVLFEANGGFGIGTNAPATPLHIKGQGTTFGTALSEVVMTVEPKTSTDDVSLAINKLDATKESALMFSINKTPEFDIRNVNGGSLDFNYYNSITGTPSFMMRINNKTVDRIDFNTNIEPQVDNLYRLGSSNYRWSTIYAQNPLDTPSDKRLKKDIIDMDYGLAEILAMRPVTYHWKKGNTKRVNLGLIAQEVEDIIPEIVQKANDVIQTRSMRYSELIPVLIKATQEQQKLIEQQNQEISELKTMLKDILSQKSNELELR